MKNDNCIFCKLANGDIPTNAIYEDGDFKVILDASPASRGHALILPKQHYADIYEIEPDTLAKAALLAQKVIAHETPVLGCDGYNLVQNNGETAGQTVFHFHMHLIPRYAADNRADDVSWGHTEFTNEEFEEICNLMKF
jgi:histidine triad (HIT) family protein